MSRAHPVPAHVLARRQRIGAQIRAARLGRKLTQETVADRAGGMDRATYVRIEQGQASPLLDTLILIADAIGVPLAELVRE
ncbi:helix-turn-helix domain-containing protein [Streptomyces sp. APSN-46.1]|uniref:helix-turn-helix domain-containing protein n=1 Tax=Streptomyces sp. APSN-46.1 TaxID=2929049 RepID=UPI001FB4DD4F|nr:helix-turn-helix transcriptional regulator [Streptomyces sp. APSN-46.1]MCJ1677521.1 helix-turn-helix domain-containing protein [Streptomyces sp. APSN-46.1]